MRLDPRELGCRCDECPLKGHTPVLPTPARDNKPRLVIVGEGPGRTEERVGRPFVGKSGALLDEALKQAGIDRNKCHVTNAALCRGELDKDNEKAAECCAPRLLREVSDCGVAVLTLGKIPTKVLLGVNSIVLARGFVWRARELDEQVKNAEKAVRRLEKKGLPSGPARAKLESLTLRNSLAGRTVFPTVHPAFVLRSEAWRALFDIDIGRVGRYLRGEILELEDSMRRCGTIDEFLED